MNLQKPGQIIIRHFNLVSKKPAIGYGNFAVILTARRVRYYTAGILKIGAGSEF